MNLMSCLLLVFNTLIYCWAPWYTDFKKAAAAANNSNKMLLLNFSGSDWCGPCIRMKKDIFDSAVFEGYAKKRLVLINADFPRLEKNKLDIIQIKQNEDLVSKYNPEGKFPYTILMSSKGEVVREWEGLPQGSPDLFIADIEKAINTNKAN